MRIRYATGFDEAGNWYCIPEDEYIRQQKAAPQFISDEMEPTLHPCDGQYYTSKAKFREVTRAHGKVEVGNEYNAFMSMKPNADPRAPMRESLKNALEFCQTIQGKSESERREIEARFYTDEGAD